MTDMIDMTDQDQLDILEKALWQYRSPMTLPAGVDPLATWQAVLQKNPSLQAYVKDVHMTAIPKGGYVLTVQYMNTNIHPRYVYMVASVHELLCIMGDMAKNFVEEWVVLLPVGVDVTEAESVFHDYRIGLYPNLTATHLQVTYLQMGTSVVCTGRYIYRIPREILIERDKDVEAVLENVAKSLFHPQMPWYVKAYLAYLYVAKTMVYTPVPMDADPDRQSRLQSAYGGLVDRQCVCQGASEALARLLCRGGVMCRVVCGDVLDGTRHGWNMVKSPTGEVGHYDVTWAAMHPHASSQYFHASDMVMAKSRTWLAEEGWSCLEGEDFWHLAQAYVRLHREELKTLGVPAFLLV